MANCIDAMQLIFFLGFINNRYPINGVQFFDQMRAYQHLYIGNEDNYWNLTTTEKKMGKFMYI